MDRRASTLQIGGAMKSWEKASQAEWSESNTVTTNQQLQQMK